MTAASLNIEMNMKNQYCKYCSHCCAFEDDMAYCEIKNKTYSKAQCSRLNKCKSFEFNEIDAFDLTKTYKPREKKQEDQVNLYNYMEKQGEKNET